jgi:glutamine synthetase type III
MVKVLERVIEASVGWERAEPFESEPVEKIFGSQVFTLDRMRSALPEAVYQIKSAIDILVAANRHGNPATRLEYGMLMRDRVLPAMNQVRSLADRLEKMVPDELWPLPIYREMLFIK